jgi:hypothetical protein
LSNFYFRQLVTTCEFVEFSRDMINLKIEEDMEKVLMEPEMTCLAEEDAKHEAFSTRIGRSFTFQKRSHFENEKYVIYKKNIMYISITIPDSKKSFAFFLNKVFLIGDRSRYRT